MLLSSVHVSLQGQIKVQSGLVDVLLSLFLQVSYGSLHKACRALVSSKQRRDIYSSD